MLSKEHKSKIDVLFHGCPEDGARHIARALVDYWGPEGYFGRQARTRLAAAKKVGDIVFVHAGIVHWLWPQLGVAESAGSIFVGVLNEEAKMALAGELDFSPQAGVWS